MANCQLLLNDGSNLLLNDGTSVLLLNDDTCEGVEAPITPSGGGSKKRRKLRFRPQLILQPRFIEVEHIILHKARLFDIMLLYFGMVARIFIESLTGFKTKGIILDEIGYELGNKSVIYDDVEKKTRHISSSRIYKVLISNPLAHMGKISKTKLKKKLVELLARDEVNDELDTAYFDLGAKKLEHYFLSEGRPNLKLTKTSQTADRIQDELTTELNRWIKKFKTLRQNGTHSYEMKLKHSEEIHNIIASYMEDAYQAGRKYAHKALGTKYPLVDKDLQNLAKIINHIETRFWGLVDQLEREVKEFGFDLLASYIATLISDAITKAVNTATLSELEPLPFDLQRDELIEVEFVTRRDEKVCPICEPLDGSRYSLDDFTKPEIPDSTHPNCRCRYLVFRNNELVSG